MLYLKRFWDLKIEKLLRNINSMFNLSLLAQHMHVMHVLHSIWVFIVKAIVLKLEAGEA